MEHSYKTLVLGASKRSYRYAYIAVQRLKDAGIEVVPVGIEEGEVHGIPILNDWPVDEQIDTITLYLNPAKQEAYYDKIVQMKPRRVIFNPGTENHELISLLHENGIETEIACTLVLLSTNQYKD